MGREPPIVMGDRKELACPRCQAAAPGHALICEYLYSAFSLTTTPGPGLRDDQLEALQCWRGVIFAIAREETLHWAVAQNMLKWPEGVQRADAEGFEPAGSRRPPIGPEEVIPHGFGGG